MANRFFNQFGLSLEKNPVSLWARVTFGGTGAPTLDAVNSKGIKSIVRNSAGNYTVTFGVGAATDIYNRIFHVRHNFLLGSGTPAAPLMYTVSQAVASTGSLVIQFTAVDGTTATDPASGEEVWLEFKLKNSTAQ